MLKRLVALAGATMLSFGLVAGAQALDPRVRDADGDIVADAPANPAEWIDPATLVFAYTPVEDPAVYAKI